MVIRSALHSQLKFSLSSREREYFYVYLRALLQALLLLYRVIEAAAHTDMELCSLASPSVLPEPHRSRTGTMRTCLKRTRSRAFVERVLLHMCMPAPLQVRGYMEAARRQKRNDKRTQKQGGIPSECLQTVYADNCNTCTQAASSWISPSTARVRATKTGPGPAPALGLREEGYRCCCLDHADRSRKMP